MAGLVTSASDSVLARGVVLPHIMSESTGHLPGFGDSAVLAESVAGQPSLDYAALRAEAEALRPEISAVRRDLRKHPETAFAEHRTAALILEHIQRIPGVTRIRTGVCGTGVVCSVFGTLGQAAEDVPSDPSAATGTSFEPYYRVADLPPIPCSICDDTDTTATGSRSPLTPTSPAWAAISPVTAAAQANARASARAAEGPLGPDGNRLGGFVTPDFDGPVVLIRGDMDALVMEDGLPADCSYRSVHPNKAHTCGHDIHVSTLIYGIHLAARRRHLFRGELRFVFQPAEETTGGALPMVREGVAEGVSAAVSLHVMTWNEAGTVGVRDGIINASEDSFYVTVAGGGGHAAEPHLATNPIVTACAMVSATHSWLTKAVCALKPVVLTVSHISSGSDQAVNVIPESCKFSATLRCHDEGVRESVCEKLPQMWRTVAEAYDCEASVDRVKGYMCGFNHTLVAGSVRRTTTALYGTDALEEIPDPEMGSEDFFEFGQNGKIPVCQFWLGGANEEKGITGDNHCPDFDADEMCLPIGSAVLAASAIDLCHQLAAGPRRQRKPHRGLRPHFLRPGAMFVHPSVLMQGTQKPIVMSRSPTDGSRPTAASAASLSRRVLSTARSPRPYPSSPTEPRPSAHFLSPAVAEALDHAMPSRAEASPAEAEGA
eukprot:TRINITY_DN34495_c0_g1_i1.p1 TRINITY_DN34495_c0_g1~~TRINITY_DN34495_c0_g1_i1.p1  ORF type:complete len:660 (-),score=139.66 TRINITY_DN34495_c0_g1_i1:9-1988(-)